MISKYNSYSVLHLLEMRSLLLLVIFRCVQIPNHKYFKVMYIVLFNLGVRFFFVLFNKD